MEITQQPKLNFSGVDIINFSFASTNPYDGKLPIDIAINPQVYFLKEDTQSFKIILRVELKAENFFELGLTAIGSFKMEGEIPDKMRKSILNANAPAIMFPYVRSFITFFTTNSGTATTPLIIPPHTFRGEIPILTDEELIKNKA